MGKKWYVQIVLLSGLLTDTEICVFFGISSTALELL